MGPLTGVSRDGHETVTQRSSRRVVCPGSLSWGGFISTLTPESLALSGEDEEKYRALNTYCSSPTEDGRGGVRKLARNTHPGRYIRTLTLPRTGLSIDKRSSSSPATAPAPDRLCLPCPLSPLGSLSTSHIHTSISASFNVPRPHGQTGRRLVEGQGGNPSKYCSKYRYFQYCSGGQSVLCPMT